MKVHSLTLFFIVLVLSSCTEDPQMEQEDPSIEQMEVFDLLLPVRNSNTSHCCLEFEWESIEGEDSYHLILSQNSDFSEPLVDSTLSSTSFFFDSALIPNQEYFWKVSSVVSHTEANSVFSVIDYGSKYNGVHSVTVDYRTWLIGVGTTLDTTYSSSLFIGSSNPGFIKIKDEDYTYNLSNDPDVVKFYVPSDNPRYHKYGRIYLQQDSIYLKSGLNANGGGHSLSSSGSLEN